MQKFAYKIIRFDDEEGIFDDGAEWEERRKGYQDLHDRHKAEKDRERVLCEKVTCNRVARQIMLDELGADGWEVTNMKTRWGSWGGECGRIFLRKESLSREVLKGVVSEVLAELQMSSV